VRKAGEKAGSPDAYSINVGVVPIGAYRPANSSGPDLANRTQYPDLVAALEAALKTK
jgi:hypothetical protein